MEYNLTGDIIQAQFSGNDLRVERKFYPSQTSLQN
jgi:hypothetical protein